MPSLDTLDHPLAEVLRLAFADLVKRGDADVVPNPDGDDAGTVEVQGDAWTLHAEGWPLGVAWIALDETPSSHAEQLAALDAVLGAYEMAALRDADGRLDGALTAVLADSGDALSAALALVLGGASEPDDDQADPQDADDPA